MRSMLSTPSVSGFWPLTSVQSADTEAKPPILRVPLADTLPMELDFFSGISHSVAEDCGEDHLDVFEEGIVMEVIEI